MYRLLCVGLIIAVVTAISGGMAVATASPTEPVPTITLETHRVAEAATQKSAEPTTETDRWGRWYMGAHIGTTIVNDVRIKETGIDSNVIFKPGIGFGFTFGYRYTFGLRLESEFTYRINETETLELFGAGLKITEATGSVDATTIFLNAWYEFNLNMESISWVKRWMPYLGGGLGYAKFEADPGGWAGFPRDELVFGSETTYAWQAGGGLTYRYTDSIHISLDYRFMRHFGGALSFDDALFPDPLKVKYKSQSIMIGFRGYF